MNVFIYAVILHIVKREFLGIHSLLKLASASFRSWVFVSYSDLNLNMFMFKAMQKLIYLIFNVTSKTYLINLAD